MRKMMKHGAYMLWKVGTYEEIEGERHERWNERGTGRRIETDNLHKCDFTNTRTYAHTRTDTHTDTHTHTHPHVVVLVAVTTASKGTNEKRMQNIKRT